MSKRSRLLLIAFAVLGLGASMSALYVHYRLITDPSYASFCDISETVSCQQVFQSAYGSILGVPVAAGGALWSALVLLLAVMGLRHPASDLAGRVAGYVFGLATIGLAAVFYFAYASLFVLGQACPLCMAMYVSVAGIFLVSASAASSLTAIPARLGDDLGRITRSQTATTAAVAWLAAALALVVFFPREQTISAEDAVFAEAPLPPELEAMSPEQIAEWENYLDSQTPVEELAPSGGTDTRVRLVKFNDYQCPACRQTWLLYRGIIAKYEAEYPDAFVYESRDFPLEAECGAGGGHGMACEAAAAVRMAREKDKHREMEAWLFANQSFEMTRDDVKRGLQQVAQITDFDERYPELIDDVRADAQLGQRIGVDSTPTFYINGIRIGNLRPAYFDATIRYALKKAGVTS